MPFGRGICLIWADCQCTIPYSYVTYCCCSYNIVRQESKAKVFEHRQKKEGKNSLALTLTVTPSPNHLATSHCWQLWCTALSLTHQPQYDMMTYCKEQYMKNNLLYGELLLYSHCKLLVKSCVTLPHYVMVVSQARPNKPQRRLCDNESDPRWGLLTLACETMFEA